MMAKACWERSSLAAGRRAAVDDLDGDGGAGVAGVRGLVGAPDAGDRVHGAARGAAVPERVARRRDQRALVLVPVARRRCMRMSCVFSIQYTHAHAHTLADAMHAEMVMRYI